jgi:hypothetical protein
MRTPEIRPDQVRYRIASPSKTEFRSFNDPRTKATRKLTTLALAFLARDFRTAQYQHSLELQDCDPEGVNQCLARWAAGNLPTIEALMTGVPRPNIARFDNHLSSDLMTMVTLRERLDYGALQGIAINLCDGHDLEHEPGDAVSKRL